MDRYDAAEKYGSLYEACKRITSKMLLISLSGDWLFSEQQSRDIVQEMLKLRKDVSYSHLDVKVGHDGFLTNIEELSKVLGGYMRSGDIPPTIRDFHRLRYQAVMDMVKPSSHVLDIGCGSGRLMNMLRTEKNVTSVGVDIAFNKIVSSLKGGNTVVFDDIDEGLSVIPEGTYDLAVLSETLQAVKRPQELLRRILCIADEAVVSFPNFAELTVRIQLGLKGRMPKGKQLPFEWYNTPNIHLFTLKDFKALCKEEGIEIKEIRSEARGKIGRFLLALGFSNIGASRVTARTAKKNNVKK
jgi:homoserine O-acetyltransferase